ncbi:MAG: hypothetical protein QXK37_05680 [Candidatus Woesearchaeota archaeon]
MTKVLNVVFGIAVGVVVFVLALLGIQAFYPDVNYEDFCPQQYISEPRFGFEICTDNITVGECRALISGRTLNTEQRNCEIEFNNAMKAYNKNFFIIASSLGVLIILVAFFLTITSISAGIACSGIVLILSAFIRGWESTDDRLKFVVGIVITAIVTTLGVIVSKRKNRIENKKH